jgi:hypothetical protein
MGMKDIRESEIARLIMDTNDKLEANNCEKIKSPY